MDILESVRRGPERPGLSGSLFHSAATALEDPGGRGVHYGILLLDRFDVALFRADLKNCLACEAFPWAIILVEGLVQI